jgi:hypothetical protein
VDASGIPVGCSIDHRGGGRYHAFVGDRPLKSEGSDEPHLFPKKELAIQALVEVAAAIAKEAADAAASPPAEGPGEPQPQT